jgi:hypothetical protein
MRRAWRESCSSRRNYRPPQERRLLRGVGQREAPPMLFWMRIGYSFAVTVLSNTELNPAGIQVPYIGEYAVTSQDGSAARYAIHHWVIRRRLGIHRDPRNGGPLPVAGRSAQTGTPNCARWVPPSTAQDPSTRHDVARRRSTGLEMVDDVAFLQSKCALSLDSTMVHSGGSTDSSRRPLPDPRFGAAPRIRTCHLPATTEPHRPRHRPRQNLRLAHHMTTRRRLPLDRTHHPHLHRPPRPTRRQLTGRECGPAGCGPGDHDCDT